MPIQAAKLEVVVGADTKPAETGLRRVQDALNGFANKFGGGQSFDILKGVLGANLLMAGVSQIKSLTGEAIKAYGSFERLGLSLQSLTAKEILASGQAANMTQALALAGPKAEELLNWIRQLAIESPFSQEGVAQAFRTAQAYGFTAEEAKRLTAAMIDFTSATGASEGVMNQVALALGQIQAKGKLAGQEVLQLVNAGISVDRILAQAFGKSTAEIVEMREKGLIPADRAIQAIVKSLETDYAGAAQRASGTMDGLVNSLGDLKEIGLAEFFKGTFEEIQPLIAEFVDSFNTPETMAAIRQMGQEFGDFVGGVIDLVRDGVEWFSELDDTTKKLIFTFGGLVLLGPTIIRLISGLIGVALAASGGISALVTNFGTLFSAYRSGLTLQTSLMAGFGSMAPLALGLGAAIGVAVGAWVLYTQTIGKAAKEQDKLLSQNWEGFFKSQVSGYRSATQAIESFLSAQSRYAAQAREAAGIWDVFIFKSMATEEAVAGITPVIAAAGAEYQDYAMMVMQAHQEMGDLNQSQIDAQMNFLAMGGSIDQLITDLGGLSKAEFEMSKASAEAIKKVEGMGTAAMDARDMAVAYNKALEENPEKANAAAAANDNLAESLAQAAEDTARALLNIGLAGELSGITEDYKTTLSDLAMEHANLTAEIEKAISQGYSPMGSKVTELNGKLAENESAQYDAATAMAEATRQMVYQQAAAGLTADAAFALAHAMGVISDADYAVGYSINELKSAYDLNRDGLIDAQEAASGYTQAVELMQQALVRLQEADIPVTYANIQQAMADLAAGGEDADLSLDTTPLADSEIEIGRSSEEIMATYAEMSKSAETASVDMGEAFTSQDWTAIGAGIGAGVAAGITTSTPVVVAAATAAAMAAYNAMLAALGIQSPSQAFADIGEQTMAGLAMGIRENISLPVNASGQAAMATAAATSYSYQTNITIPAMINTPIDQYALAQIIADEIREGQL